MKTIKNFLSLIRFPNLVFIFITQVLFYYCILNNLELNFYINKKPIIAFWCIAFASILIAAGGYIINDYFDINIDRINKPGQNKVENGIGRRWAIFLHSFFSLLGIILTIVAGYLLDNFWLIGILNFGATILLWFYSTSFKKQLILGNVIISILLAWVIGVLYIAYFPWDVSGEIHPHLIREVYSNLLKYAILYMGFSFIISLIREAVKDIEDEEGDRKYNCNTMPIAWGLQTSKVFIGVWYVVMTIVLIIVILFGIQFSMWISVVYATIFVLIPLLFWGKKFLKANTKQDFAFLSKLLKYIIFLGILSMVALKLDHFL